MVTVVVEVRAVKVGEDAVPMSCGVESVIVPAPLVTVTWFVVPVRVAMVGAVVPSPMRSCPLARTAVAVIADVPAPRRTPPSVSVATPVPPEATPRAVEMVSEPDISRAVAGLVVLIPTLPPTVTVIPELVAVNVPASGVSLNLSESELSNPRYHLLVPASCS